MMIEETFPSVFAVFDYLKSKGWGGFYHTNPHFEVMQLAENQLAACPMPMNPLYRAKMQFTHRVSLRYIEGIGQKSNL